MRLRTPYDILDFIENMNLHGEKFDEVSVMEYEDNFNSRKAAFLCKDYLPKELSSEQHQVSWAVRYWRRAWIV